MDPKAIEKLRLDRRLHRRRDWISDEELARELEALPDVSDKIDHAGGEDDAEPAAETPSGA